MQEEKQQEFDETKDKRRKDWEFNHELISQAFFDIVTKTKKYPTIQAISEATNLSRKTVSTHLNDDEMYEEQKKNMRAIRDRAYMALSAKAMKGEDVKWMQLFFEITDKANYDPNTQKVNLNINITRGDD